MNRKGDKVYEGDKFDLYAADRPSDLQLLAWFKEQQSWIQVCQEHLNKKHVPGFVESAQQDLIRKGLLTKTDYFDYAVTDKGRRRLEEEGYI